MSKQMYVCLRRKLLIDFKLLTFVTNVLNTLVYYIQNSTKNMNRFTLCKYFRIEIGKINIY